MSRPSVYLAGPVRHAEDSGRGWRDAIAAVNSHIEWLNPLDEYDAPASDVEIVNGHASSDNELGVATLVESDMRLIREADAVLVGYSTARAVGTPMEVMFASEHDTPVVIWTRAGQVAEQLSPWYRYHANLITPHRRDAVKKVEVFSND